MMLFTLAQRRQLVRNGQHITQTGDEFGRILNQDSKKLV